MEHPGPQRSRAPYLVAAGLALVAVLAMSGSARAAWRELSRILSLHRKPEPASANVLSEHHIESLAGMSAQAQAEFLLERSINHYEGANDQIAARVGRWRGKLDLNERLNGLFMMAINSDDLRVRAAGVEVDIAARNLEKTVETADRLKGPSTRTLNSST